VSELKPVEPMTAEDLRRAGDALHARAIAQAWIATCKELKPEHATHYRLFVLGYLAAVKNRT
jgi:hypothetical protein